MDRQKSTAKRDEEGAQTTSPGCASRYARTLAESRDRLYSSETEVVGEVGVVAVSGEMDLCTAGRFRRDIEEAAARSSGDLVLDLSRVDMIDSTALGVMLQAQRGLSEDGRSLVLVVTRPHVMRILTITGLQSACRLAASTAEAIRQVTAGPARPRRVA
jgi:anti-sigma B factor antagonist